MTAPDAPQIGEFLLRESRDRVPDPSRRHMRYRELSDLVAALRVQVEKRDAHIERLIKQRDRARDRVAVETYAAVAWKRRAERWKEYAKLIRAQAMFDLMCNRRRWHSLVKRYRRMQVKGHPWART